MLRPARASAFLFCLAVSVAVALGPACARRSEEAKSFSPVPAGEIPEARPVGVANARRPFPGILTGGQPTVAQFERAASVGYRTVVNLRTAFEGGVWDEASKAAELGMEYVSIPVAFGSGVTSENADRLLRSIADPARYPVLIHCGSADRVGALFAIAAADAGEDTERAIAIGRRAGMTTLTRKVRRVLDSRR
jgi:uncharacterized protein (TIGR01244 family)